MMALFRSSAAASPRLILMGNHDIISLLMECKTMAPDRFLRRENPIAFWTYQIYVWLIVIPLLILSTIFFVFLGVIAVILFGDKVAHRTTGVWWARFNSYITPMRVIVLGRQNIEKGQSYVVVSNHQSSYDIFVLYGWLGIDIKWVM